MDAVIFPPSPTPLYLKSLPKSELVAYRGQSGSSAYKSLSRVCTGSGFWAAVLGILLTLLGGSRAADTSEAASRVDNVVVGCWTDDGLRHGTT